MATVVVADPSAALRRLVTSVLERDGFDVVAVTDGVAAVQAVARCRPDAVVLGSALPRLSGIVVTRLLKDDWRWADLSVVLLTTPGAASEQWWAARAGADRCLAKDFQAPELVAAVRALVSAGPGRGEAAPADPPADDDVLCRSVDLLDRKLFELAVTAEVAALSGGTDGFEAGIAGLLELLGRLVEHDQAAVVLLDQRMAYVAIARDSSHTHYSQFVVAAAEAAAQVSGRDCEPDRLEVRLADPRDHLAGDDEARMATFLSMPLRRRTGDVLGVLALSSATDNAFGETALATLRSVAGPAAAMVEDRAPVAAAAG